MCSTPDGIEEELTYRPWDTAAAHYTCSTPDGIEEELTRWLVKMLGESMKCSTPDGIEEELTKPAAATASSISSAQRLTASKKNSPVQGRSELCTDPVLNA